MAKNPLPQEILFAAKSDVGNVRKHNEDNLLAAPPLFVVADGMGGHAAGEVASEIAIQTIDAEAPREMDRQRLVDACKQANRNIYQAIAEGRGKAGMGTTLTCCILRCDKDADHLMIAQIGDSRVYLLAGGNLRQLTRDHSYVQELVEQGRLSPAEAANHPKRSIITRALGGDPDTEPDIYELDVSGAERLLLCSDGLSSMVSDSEIQQIMSVPESPETTVDRLIRAAKVAGGLDNVTVIVAELPNPGHPSPQVGQPRRGKTQRRGHGPLLVAIYILVALLVVALVIFAFNWLNQAGYFVTY
ncbi:MAG: Stp1/IreP family PP2C-type Ser/Thr phosphatase [Coriobacteriales bacterium]|jgi:protein phosphatase|nr:Stp1/IreP family PP2C-type Ser/Thr phosphatase [Coriobacteriales bacterium]